MKKVFVLIVAASLLLGVGVAFAAEVTPQNGSPYAVVNAWGLTGEQSAKYHFASGTTIKSVTGKTVTCPWFFPAGCYDLTWYYAK